MLLYFLRRLIVTYLGGGSIPTTGGPPTAPLPRTEAVPLLRCLPTGGWIFLLGVAPLLGTPSLFLREFLYFGGASTRCPLVQDTI